MPCTAKDETTEKIIASPRDEHAYMVNRLKTADSEAFPVIKKLIRDIERDIGRNIEKMKDCN